MLALINDILDLSKIEAGRLEVESIEFPLAEIFQALGSIIRPAAQDKGIEFNIMLDPNVPANMKSDPLRLRQCLINLANNAVKFHSARPRRCPGLPPSMP